MSTLAAQTLRRMSFERAAALRSGMKSWRERGFEIETG